MRLPTDFLAALLVTPHLVASAQTEPVCVDEKDLVACAPPPAPAEVEPERFKQAVVRLVLEEKTPTEKNATLAIDPVAETLGAAFTEAKVPDCLHKDGLKRQPPRIGFFVFKGVLAFPFVALAAARGKCN